MPDVNNTPAPPDVLEPGRDVLQNPTAVAASSAQDAPLPVNEAKAVRAQERLTPDGKAESAERGTLYHVSENVGESGAQAGQEGVPRSAGTDGGDTVDQNPIGKRTG